MTTIFPKARCYITVAAFMLMLLGGGISVLSPQMLIVVSSASVVVLALWLVEFRDGFATRQAAWLSLLVGFAGVVIAAQLVPLPQSVWSVLPGRGFVSDALKVSGQTNVWMPLSLDPVQTRNVLISLLPGLAFFVVGQKLTIKQSWSFCCCFIAFAIFGVVLGLAQRFSGINGGLYPYVEVGNGLATGTFRNRNNFAASLYVSIPFLFALALLYLQKIEKRAVLIMIATLVNLGVIVAGLAASASRSGMLLSMAAILLSMAMAYGLKPEGRFQNNRAGVTKFALASFLVFILVFSQVGVLAIMRLAETDAMNDQRWIIWAKSFESAASFFPAGSGFGTFVPVYQLIEKPADMFEGMFVNHAHNDWLELVLEGGLAMALILFAFLFWYVTATGAAWSQSKIWGALLVPRAASISALLLMLHSLVEFPLRNPALMSSFALCLGLIAVAGKHRRELQGGQRREKPGFAGNGSLPKLKD